MAGCQTPEENAREEMRWDNEAIEQKKVRQFKSRLTRLKNRNDDQGIIDLWAEFKEWCERDDHMYPDNWNLWYREAEDAQLRLWRAKDVW